MGTSLTKRLSVYALVILAVVGSISGVYYLIYEPTSEYAIPESAKAVRNDHYDVAVKVVNEKGEPINTARVKATWHYEPGKRPHVAQVFSDDKGLAYIDLMEHEPYNIDMEIRARGYQTLYRRWGNYNTVDKKVELPEELTVELPRGETIGGIVVSQLGEPIIGAKVELISDSEWHTDQEYYSRLRESIPTDENGRWELTNAPPEMNDLQISVSHSSHLEGRARNPFSGNYKAVSKSGIEQMKSKTHRMEMERGLIVKGRITNEAGEPIPNAMVILGRDPYQFRNSYMPRSDHNGSFTYKLGVEGSGVLTILTPEYKPEEVPVNITPDMGSVNIQLKKGTPLKIAAKDSSGKPINDVAVQLQQWDQNSCIQLLFPRDEPLKTNADGIAIWENAPSEPVSFVLVKDGLMPVSGNYAPSEVAHALTMSGIKRIVVSAVDAESGEAIENFSVAQGQPWRVQDGKVLEYRYDRGQRQAEKKFEQELHSPDQKLRLKVYAPGHKPTETEEIKAEDMTGDLLELTVKLPPGKGPKGRILSPDGKPVSGATVALYGEDGQTQIYNGELPQWNRNSNSVTTNEKGEFQFDPQDGDYGLVALSEEGFMRIEAGDVPDVGDHQLGEWATVSGQLKIGDEPAAEQQVSLQVTSMYYNPRDPGRQRFRLWMNYSAQTDTNGTFKFERVAPGEYEIIKQKMVPYGDRGTRALPSGLTRFAIEAGEEKTLDVGGFGRPVKGKLTFPEEMNVTRVDLNARIVAKVDEASEGVTEIQGKAAISNFLGNLAQSVGATPQGSAEGTDNSERVEIPYQPYHMINVDDDGNFEFDELPPGNYQLTGTAYSSEDRNDWGRQVGNVQHTFEVPEPAEGEAKFIPEPLDLGELTITPPEERRQFRSAF